MTLTRDIVVSRATNNVICHTMDLTQVNKIFCRKKN